MGTERKGGGNGTRSYVAQANGVAEDGAERMGDGNGEDVDGRGERRGWEMGTEASGAQMTRLRGDPQLRCAGKRSS